ncbi:hypothetical protein QCA50_017962 [Cerrena zonata]|uniref:CHAT domain-containing protein n=1 Tax=Cerrena zonata TaxID=2478898 RepID=A0AAW0FDZ8_9APHY
MEKASEGRLWPAERQVLNILMAEIYLEPEFPYRDLSKAINFMHRDLLDTSQPITTRIRTVMRFFRPIMTGHFDLRSVSSEVGTYLSDATRLLPNALNFGQDLRTRLEAAADARHLVTYAASYYLQVDQPDKAVALLEQGRTLFWTKPLQLRALKVSSFPPSVDPSVHDLIEEMERQMHSNNKRYRDHDKIEVEAEYMYRENLKARVPQMLEAIEKTPGLDNFLTPEEFGPELLAEVSRHGPVVMLVASSQIAHAIMITSPGKVTAIPLPNVHEEGLRGIQWLVRGDEADINLVNDACRSLQLSLNIDSPPEDGEMISMLSKLTGSVSSSSSSRDVDDMDDDRAGKPRRKVKPTRESYVWLGYCFLWYNIVDPVLKSLGISKATGRDRPRLWWCPTGEFCLLPIHAASRGNMEVVSDYVVSSYTPSLRALVDARRAYKPIARKACRVLLGAVPRPATGSPLPNTVDEALRVVDVIPEKLVLPLPPEDTVLYDPFVSGLSKASFLSNLSKTNFLHLACHGHQNSDNPFESGFMLRDKYVSMSEIMPIASDNALLAFLSACESARGNGSQPDDATHLAATMLFKGFKSIIGTTWRMDDMDGPEVAETVYRELFSERTSISIQIPSRMRWMKL